MNRLNFQPSSAARWSVEPRPWARTVYAAIVLVALVSASLATMAQSGVDADLALYRCAVLGDTRSCRQPEPRPEVWCEERVELGAYALYLRHLGADTDEAIAKAMWRGEKPHRYVVQVTRIVLSPDAARARGMGARITPDESRRTLAVAPAITEPPQPRDDRCASLLALRSK